MNLAIKSLTKSKLIDASWSQYANVVDKSVSYNWSASDDGERELLKLVLRAALSFSPLRTIFHVISTGACKDESKFIDYSENP